MALFNRTSSALAEEAPAASNVSGDYVLDPAHTRIGFSARHAMVTKVRGQFDEFAGTAHVDAEDPTKPHRGGHHPDRQGHHRPGRSATTTSSARFFDVENYPEELGSSRPTSRRDGTEWSITGDLTINAVTKPVTVLFEETGTAKDPFGNLRAGFEGAATINRGDWGLDLQRRARDRWRPRLREGHPGVRHLGDPSARLTPASTTHEGRSPRGAALLCRRRTAGVSPPCWPARRGRRPARSTCWSRARRSCRCRGAP